MWQIQKQVKPVRLFGMNIQNNECLVFGYPFLITLSIKESYHKFTDITNRKKEKAVFLNKLKDGPGSPRK